MHTPQAQQRLLGTPPASPQTAFDSRDLMRGTREVLIRHGDQVYRLRHTRNDKLILVK